MSKKSKTGRLSYVIGDIHGCFAELCELIGLICEDAEANDIDIYSIGDMIDKGPASNSVLEMFLLDSLPQIRFFAIMGNHEEKAIRWCNAQDREEEGGSKNQVGNKWNFEKIREYHELMAELPLWIALPEYKVLLVHGGIEPKMAELPPPALKDANRYQKNVLRVRYVSENGKMVSLGEERLDQGDKWWADVYDGRFGTVIYGHQPYGEVTYHKHAIGIDTGCVLGGKLTALRLNKTGKHEVLSVSAKAKYCKAYDEE